MIRSLMTAAVALSVMAGTAAGATQCRDPKTHRFIKCPPPAVKVTSTTVSKTSTTNHCRDAKGRFAKCGTPGTHPA